MKLYNIKDHSEVVSFAQAVRQGLGRNQGLFFPEEIVPFDDADALLDLPFVERSGKILRHLIGDEIPNLEELVANAFAFGAPVARVDDRTYALELFHGPTLAFKDFGARFAVAHAFYNLPNIDVVILYPEGKISNLQEKLFCTLGGNIRTVAVKAAFDDCQALVKAAFDDPEVRDGIGLNSANSINISRLLAQVCYYFEAVAQLPAEKRNSVVFSVPSGNFGDLTAGLIARALGLRVRKFITATNVNDTVPRFLATGEWDPHPTQATLSNAMDVSRPNNWPRVLELFRVKGWDLKELGYGRLTDAETEEAMRELKAKGYTSEPHGTIAWKVLDNTLQDGDTGVFLCTASPAKFKENVDRILGIDLPLPEALSSRADMKVLSVPMTADFGELKKFLLNRQ